MAVDTSVIGQSTGSYVATVERAPVAKFAAAVLDANPIYANRDAAVAAGFANTPAPPTFTFALPFWGALAEQQPPDPTKGSNPMHTIMGQLHGLGAMVLHGEQEFTYHRPIVAGDVLAGDPKIVDVYEKDTDKATMTFVVIETVWRDAASDEPVLTERFNLIARLKK
jgi:acyl dehydratase